MARVHWFSAGSAIGCALIAAMAMPQPAHALDVELKPSSPWNMHWDSDSCVLRRAFGEGPQPFIVRFERFGPSSGFKLSMFGPQLSRLQPTTRLTLVYGGAAPRKVPVSFQLGEYKPDNSSKSMVSFFTSSSLSELDKDGAARAEVTPDMEAAVTSVGATWAGTRIVLNTGPLDKPFAAMRKCTDNLVSTWGLDPAIQANLSRGAEPLSNPGTWLKSKDYPSQMLREGKQALVNFRLNVDIQGLPTSCTVQRSYNDKLFDEITCAKLMERARFSPALDAAGKPVPSYHLNTVKWIMSQY